MDGLWTRTRSGRTEIKVVRDENGVALAAAERWEQVIDLARQQGVAEPLHLVSDGDRAIESAIALVYGRQAPHQLCQFHLLREYRRNLGWTGWREAGGYAAQIVELTEGDGEYWCRKALGAGL